MTRHRKLVATAVIAQALLLLLAIGPQLSPRIRGDEVRLLVEPVDPIDPFRGAYVDLEYARSGGPGSPTGRIEGDAYVPLVGRGAGPYRLGPARATRPASGRFLRCAETGTSCGIESYFASQTEARRLERELGGVRGRAVARVRIDGAGRAALLAVEPRERP